MRKKVLGLVMAALAVSTFGAFAQTETSVQPQACEQTSKECKKDRKECKKGDKKKGDRKKGDFRKDDKVRGHKGDFNLFEGIELTADQQQQLDQLRSERKAKKEEMKKADRQVREQSRKEFDEKVAQILTPEQYKQFEANQNKMKAKKVMKTEAKKHKDGKKKPLKKSEMKEKGVRVEKPVAQ